MDSWWVSGLALFLYGCIGIGIIVAWSEIFIKAGYSRWFCFLMIIPVVNLIVFFWFAYSKWPIHEFVSRDWRRKLLEEKKAKLEREISSLTDDSTNTETRREPEQTETKTEERSDVQEAERAMSPEGQVVFFILVAAIIIGILIIIFRGC